MKRIGVVLSGCGVFDGSEIQEVILTLLAIEQAGAEAVFFAPDVEQVTVINHINGEAQTDVRRVLVEAARLTRGNITPLADADANTLDALIIPGGFGVVHHLSDFAQQRENCSVNEQLHRLFQEIHKQCKPIGLMCIAPVLVPKLVASEDPVRITIGNDPDTIEIVEDMGAEHVICPVEDIVVDEAQRIVTTPAWMVATRISDAARGIDKLVRRVVEMTL